MRCQHYIGKNKDNWPQLIESKFNVEKNVTYTHTTLIDPLYIWVTILVEQYKDHDYVVPVCLDGFGGISEKLKALSGNMFDFTPNIPMSTETVFSELSFDTIRVLHAYSEGAVGISKIDSNIDETYILTLQIKFKEDTTIVDNILNIVSLDETHIKSSDVSHKSKLITIPYFVVDGKNDFYKYRFVDVPFKISLSSQKKPTKTDGTVFKSVHLTNKSLYMEHLCFLRDYTHFKRENSTNKEDVVYARIDPMIQESMKNIIPNEYREGTFGVSPNIGCLSLSSISFDQWYIRDCWGQYDQGISDHMDIVYVGHHSSDIDENILGFNHSFHKVYCSPEFFDFYDQKKKLDISNKVPSTGRVTLFFPGPVPLYKVGSVYRFGAKITDTIDTKESTIEFVDIFIYCSANDKHVDIGLIGETDYMTFEDIKKSFKNMTWLKETYLELICNRLLPFLCTYDTDSSTLKVKNTVQFKLTTCNNEINMQSKITNLVTRTKYKIPPMVYHYGQKLQKYDYKKYVNVFCTANFDDITEEILLKKKGTLLYVNYGYENILNDGRSLLKIAIELCRLCHASIHEVLFGGKMLWHLRGMEYLFAKYGKPKPSKLHMLKRGINDKIHKAIYDNSGSDLYYGLEEWKVFGAHVSEASVGWFLENDENGDILPHDQYNALILDFDGYYNSIICEYKIGFICHSGTMLSNELNESKVGFSVSRTSMYSENDMDVDNNNSYTNNVFMMKEMYTHFTGILDNRRDIKQKIAQKIVDKNDPHVNATYVALKLASNSFFGCCGKDKSPISSKFVANYITAQGRRGVLIAQKVVKDVFSLKVGMSHTDGICVLLPKTSLKEELINEINGQFINEYVKITVEEVFESIFIKNKTTYFGIRNVSDWIKQSQSDVDILIKSIKSYHKKIVPNDFFHNLLMNIPNVNRGNAIKLDTIMANFNKNVKCKGLTNKNWSLCERIILTCAILYHASTKFHKHALTIKNTVQNMVFNFSDMIVEEFCTGENVFSVILTLTSELEDAKKYFEALSLKMGSPEEKPQEFYNSNNRTAQDNQKVSRYHNIFSELFDSVIMQIFTGTHSDLNSLKMKYKSDLYEKMETKVCFGFEMDNHSVLCQTKNVQQVHTVYLTNSMQMIQYLMCSDVIIKDIREVKAEDFVNQNELDNKYVIHSKTLFNGRNLVPTKAIFTKKDIIRYPVTTKTIEYLPLFFAQRNLCPLQNMDTEINKLYHIFYKNQGLSDIQVYVDAIYEYYKCIVNSLLK